MFNYLDKLVRWLVEKGLGLSMTSSLGSSVHFFVFDVVKILILLSVMIFCISYVRSYFPPEKTKRIIEKIGGVRAHIFASLLGIVTPFCSCSSVPLFIGFVEAGIPIGVTFSFLITSPIVNEAAFAILIAAFGVKVAVLYVVTGVVVGVLGGLIISGLHLEDEVEAYVYEISSRAVEESQPTQRDRLAFAVQNLKDIVGRIWIFLLIGIGIGAIIHGYVPQEFLVRTIGGENPFAVIIATIVAVPLYSNALGTIPIAEALMLKGVGLGTALSFMMATTALSLPEMILLRKVVKPKLIAYFVLITSVAIIVVGYLFNMLHLI